MKHGLLIIGVAFAITLAIIFGTRVSADALGIVVGVILGVFASIPTTLLVTFILVRSRQSLEKSIPPTSQPPVVVVTSQNPQPAYPPAPPIPVLPAQTRRSFNIIGEDGTEGD